MNNSIGTKVIAVNSSPAMKKGNTFMILDPFLNGMKEAGASVELFFTEKLNINICKGCLKCWYDVSHKCIHKDDMDWLLPKFCDADIWVFATPVYVCGVTAKMKILMERLVSVVDPRFEIHDGHSRHIIGKIHKHSKDVLVSTASLYEIDNFDPLVSQIKLFSKIAAREFAGALLRPHIDAVRQGKKGLVSIDDTSDIFEAAKEAGRELIRDGKFSSKSLKTVSREILPAETYIDAFNREILHEIDYYNKKSEK